MEELENEENKKDAYYDLNGKAGNILPVAVHSDRLNIVKMLVPHRDPNDRLPPSQYMVDVNYSKGKPLQTACRTKNFAIAKYLIEHNADANMSSEFTQTTPLMYAVQAEDVKMCEYLLTLPDAWGTNLKKERVIKARRANVNATCHPTKCGFSNGWTALHYACDKGNMEIIELLIRNGAKLDQPTVNGDTALSIAAESGRFNVVRWMVRNGAHVNCRRRQLNVCQWAIFRADPEFVKFLVSYGGQPKLHSKILWFENGETLGERVNREFDPEIMKRMDLAIYRGSYELFLFYFCLFIYIYIYCSLILALYLNLSLSRTCFVCFLFFS